MIRVALVLGMFPRAPAPRSRASDAWSADQEDRPSRAQSHPLPGRVGAACKNQIRVVLIVVYLISLAVTLMCGIAAITISAALVTGKLTDPEDWTTAVLIAALGVASWLLCRAAKDLIED